MLRRLENKPPSVVFITVRGAKSGVVRAAPTPTANNMVCGDPGLSEIYTAGEGGAGDDGTGAVKPSPVQPPKYFCANARAWSSVKSPAITSAEFDGTAVFFHMPRRSSRVAAFVASSV